MKILRPLAIALATAALTAAAGMSNANSFKLRPGAPTLDQLNEQISKVERELDPLLTQKERDALSQAKLRQLGAVAGDDAAAYGQQERLLQEMTRMLEERRLPLKASEPKR